MRRGRKARRGQRGHTLIEVMIAGAIFTIGALGLLRLIVTSGEGLRTSSKLTQASSLARTKLDELANTSYDALVAGSYTEGANNIGPAGTPYKPDGSATAVFHSTDGMFARSWTITEDTALGYKAITVLVEWFDHGRKAWYSVSLVGGRSHQ